MGKHLWMGLLHCHVWLPGFNANCSESLLIPDVLFKTASSKSLHLQNCMNTHTHKANFATLLPALYTMPGAFQQAHQLSSHYKQPNWLFCHSWGEIHGISVHTCSNPWRNAASCICSSLVASGFTCRALSISWASGQGTWPLEGL
jgi:hypothetical protein